MSSVIEIAKAATIAYNNKNWDNVKDVFAPDGVYDEKGTHRRIQGVEKIMMLGKGGALPFPTRGPHSCGSSPAAIPQ
jgi:hypothetical protein